MERLHDHITVNHIQVEAQKGARLDSAILEGIALAAKENILVKLIHNENAYWINPSNLITDIAKNPIMPTISLNR